MSIGLVEQVRRDFYRFAEAANTLNIADVTLWRWVRDGKLEVHRIGREVLIEKKVVDALRK